MDIAPERLSTADVARLLGVGKRQVRRLALERGWERETPATGRPVATYARLDVLREMSDRGPDVVNPNQARYFRGKRPAPSTRRPPAEGPSCPPGAWTPATSALEAPGLVALGELPGDLRRLVLALEALEARHAAREARAGALALALVLVALVACGACWLVALRPGLFL